MRHDHVSARLIFRAAILLALGACASAPAPEPASAPASESESEPESESESASDDETETEAEAEAEMQVTESGLGIEELKVGEGPKVEEGMKVTVHFIGRLESGKVFDDSYKRHEPYTFKVGHGKVIAGWDEGVVGMQVGGKRRLTVPSKLGYGERGKMPEIPPDALLEFDIELVAIE